MYDDKETLILEYIEYDEYTYPISAINEVKKFMNPKEFLEYAREIMSSI